MDLGIIEGEFESLEKKITPLGNKLGRALSLPIDTQNSVKATWKDVLKGSPFHDDLIALIPSNKSITEDELIKFIIHVSGDANPARDKKTGVRAIIQILLVAEYITRNNGLYQLSKAIKKEYKRPQKNHQLGKPRHKIFISCGQSSESEKALGKQIKELIDAYNDFEGYFAENQQDLNGLTNNIFSAIHESPILITIMHRRD